MIVILLCALGRVVVADSVAMYQQPAGQVTVSALVHTREAVVPVVVLPLHSIVAHAVLQLATAQPVIVPQVTVQVVHHLALGSRVIVVGNVVVYQQPVDRAIVLAHAQARGALSAVVPAEHLIVVHAVLRLVTHQTVIRRTATLQPGIVSVAHLATTAVLLVTVQPDTLPPGILQPGILQLDTVQGVTVHAAMVHGVMARVVITASHVRVTQAISGVPMGSGKIVVVVVGVSHGTHGGVVKKG